MRIKTIKNPNKKHWVTKTKDSGKRYICIRACDISKIKVAKTKEEVTCLNCQRKLRIGLYKGFIPINKRNKE